MEKINLKKLFLFYACLNFVLAGIYALFLRGQVQGFPPDQSVGLATGAVLLTSILICTYAAWRWGTNTRMIKQIFRICFWAYCTLTYVQAFSPHRLTLLFSMRVQPLILLLLLGEGILVGVIIRYQEEELDLASDNNMDQLSENDEDPYDALIGKILTGLVGFMFYWLTWAGFWGYFF